MSVVRPMGCWWEFGCSIRRSYEYRFATATFSHRRQVELYWTTLTQAKLCLRNIWRGQQGCTIRTIVSNSDLRFKQIQRCKIYQFICREVIFLIYTCHPEHHHLAQSWRFLWLAIILALWKHWAREGVRLRTSYAKHTTIRLQGSSFNFFADPQTQFCIAL